MTKNFNTNTDNNDEWITPPEIVTALGHFDLDPCSPVVPPFKFANICYDKHIDGLSQQWSGRVWLNPPYGRETGKWLERMTKHRSGVALIFARTETKMFHKYIWQQAHSVFFFEGRLRFYYVDGQKGGAANAPSCLVSWSKQDTSMVKQAHLFGALRGKLLMI